jgi:hypothetical protein
MDNETDRKYASRGEFVLRSPMGESMVLVSAELAAEITAAIPDEDISAFQNITYASSLLNAPTFPTTWAERQKNGISLVQMQGSTEE